MNRDHFRQQHSDLVLAYIYYSENGGMLTSDG